MTGDGSKHGGAYLFHSMKTKFLVNPFKSEAERVKFDEKHLIFQFVFHDFFPLFF